jgi:hypothetical protein
MQLAWNSEEDTILQTNYPIGGKELCKTFLPHRSLVAIWQRSRKLSLEYKFVRLRSWTKEHINFLIENYSTKGGKYCADVLNRPLHLIRHKANIMGLTLEGDFHISNKRDFSEIFNLNNPKIVYLLGLIWADGNISTTVSISMISEDLDQILESLDICDLLIGCSIRKHQQRENWKPQTALLFGNKNILNFLKENGYTVGRFGEPKILELIPKELHHYWFRGLMDGDGSYMINKNKDYAISLTGHSNSTYFYIQNLCQELNIKPHISCRENKSGSRFSRVTILKLEDIKKFINFIYPNNINELGLDRKFNKCLELLNITLKKDEPEAIENRKGNCYYNKSRDSWRVCIFINKKKKYIGAYKTQKEALEKLEAAKLKHSL